MTAALVKRQFGHKHAEGEHDVTTKGEMGAALISQGMPEITSKPEARHGPDSRSRPQREPALLKP